MEIPMPIAKGVLAIHPISWKQETLHKNNQESHQQTRFSSLKCTKMCLRTEICHGPHLGIL